MTIKFTMPMNPPTATAQEHKVDTRGVRPRFYDPPEVRDAREKLSANLAAHAPPEPLQGAVRLTVIWRFRASGKHPPGPKTDKPDTDNLQKLLKDCMTRLGFWGDDAQVYSETAVKLYDDNPGIEVGIDYEDY